MLIRIRLSVPESRHDFSRDFAIVEVNRAVAENLICFVAFSRNQHEVAGPALIRSPGESQSRDPAPL